MPSASLDALVIKLLETTQANTDKLNFRQIKNLVCQLPAAAAEVRGIQANNERNAPCTCGLDLEVVRLQKSLQVYIDEEPNTKKGNTRKTLGMENQHLTKLVTDQKKEMNGYLATIRRQGDEIERLRQNLKAAQDAHAWSEKLRMAASARVETVARAVGREASIGEHTESVSALDAVVAAAQKHAQGATSAEANPPLASDPRLTSQYYVNRAPDVHHESRKTSFTRSIAGETAPAISDTPIVRLPRVGQVQTGTSALGSSGVNLLSHGSSSGSSRLTVKPGDSFAKTIGGRNDPISPAGAPVVSLPGPSKKRPAAEDLNTEAPKRAKTDLGIHAGPAGKVDQHAVCQNCRVLGGECNHQSRCSECDIQISPCIYVRCKDGAYCEDPSCDYLHDNQWNLKASPMWLIEGVKTVSATREGKFSWTPLSPIAPCPSEDSAIEVEDEAPRPRDPQASALEG